MLGLLAFLSILLRVRRVVRSFYPLRYFNPFAIYDGQSVLTSKTSSSITYRVPTMETVFVFCVVHVCEMEAPLIYVSIYALVTKTIWLQKQSGYKNNLVTKTYRERGYKNKKRVPPPKGYKNRWGLGGLVGYKSGYKITSKCKFHHHYKNRKRDHSHP